MAGRDISVTREALGAVRVMRTCGMMGEIVGKAAWIATQHRTSPRGVYEKHLPLLKELMGQPGALRRSSRDGLLQLPPGAKISTAAQPGIDPATLPGVVLDDDAAQLAGSWADNGSLTGFVGQGYRYSSDPKASARFRISAKEAGQYELRLAWQPHPNRAQAVPVTIRTAAGETRLTLDQTKPAQGEHGFQSIGRFRLGADEIGTVTLHVAGARGVVHLDALQMVPVR